MRAWFATRGQSARETSLYEAAFRNAPIGMAIVDADGRIIDANRALSEFLVYPLLELRSGKITFVDVTHPDYVLQDTDLFFKLQNGEIPSYRMEKIYICGDGSHKWGRLNVSRAAPGVVEMVIGQVEDITELKRANAELERMNAELTRTLRAVGQEQKETLRGRLNVGNL